MGYLESLQQASDHAGDALPVFGFGDELFPARLRNGIELGFAIVLRRAPLGLDPALLHQADEAEIDGALVHHAALLR